MAADNQPLVSTRQILDFPFHTVLFSAYPILFVYTRNIQNFSFRDINRYLILSAALFTFLLFGFGFILKDWRKGGMLSSMTSLLFYTFGHIHNATTKWGEPLGWEISASAMGVIWIALYLLLTYIIVRVDPPYRSTQYLNSFGLFLVSFSLITIITTNYIKNDLTVQEKQTVAQLRGEKQAEGKNNHITHSELPDIYYIIFDGYERSDHLKTYYGYDNGPFLNELEKRGFYICANSHSNYLNTSYSLNTSLNLTYFHQFPKKIFNKSKYNLYTNHVHDFLQELAYQTVVFDSGTGYTNDQEADIFVTPQSFQNQSANNQLTQPLNSFERFFLRTTMGRILIVEPSLTPQGDDVENWVRSTTNNYLEVRRNRIRYTLSHIPDFADQEGHYFLFAHIFLPHYPFLYGPAGKELTYQDYKELYWPQEEFKNYQKYYSYQIDYLNQAILDPIDKILDQSTKPVVIILQSDHGNHKYLNWKEPTPLGVELRSANLCAIYYSDQEYDALYPSMTPVNEFRAVFNHWFGTQYPMLQDKVYFHEHILQTGVTEKPEFIDSCERFGICLPPPPETESDIE